MMIPFYVLLPSLHQIHQVTEPVRQFNLEPNWFDIECYRVCGNKRIPLVSLYLPFSDPNLHLNGADINTSTIF